MLKRITLCLVIFVLGCTDESNSRRTLMSQGFSDITFTGYQFFACGQDDSYHTGFKAKNAKGEPVEGVVCCGVMKGCTVRF